jgi:hypothetical protein
LVKRGILIKTSVTTNTGNTTLAFPSPIHFDLTLYNVPPRKLRLEEHVRRFSETDSRYRNIPMRQYAVLNFTDTEVANQATLDMYDHVWHLLYNGLYHWRLGPYWLSGAYGVLVVSLVCFLRYFMRAIGYLSACQCCSCLKSEGCTVELSMPLCWIAFQVCSMKIIVGARRAEAWVGSVVLVMTLSGQQMTMYNLLLFFVYTRINS